MKWQHVQLPQFQIKMQVEIIFMVRIFAGKRLLTTLGLFTVSVETRTTGTMALVGTTIQCYYIHFSIPQLVFFQKRGRHHYR